MNAETFCEHFATFADAPNGVQKLRAMILQLAVQGKLVPQDPNDEPASKLLGRISADQKRREAEESARTQKALPPISADEILYELPEGWAWERLGNIGDTNIGLTYSPQHVGETGVPVLRSSNIQNGRIDLTDLVRVSMDPKSSVLVADGDLLICARNGSRALVGKVAMIEHLSEKTAFGAFMAILRSSINEYLYHFICSPLFRRVIADTNTTTINQITQSNLRSTLAPIPPLAEQRRIVEKVDQLLGLCDELAARQAAQREKRQRLVGATLDRLVSTRNPAEFPTHAHRLRNHFDQLFDTPTTIPQLRQTILQLAVQGQLVPQDPNDEPVSQLIQRAALAKSGIRESLDVRGNPAEIGAAPNDAENPLPDGWAWAQIGNIAVIRGGKRLPKGVSFSAVKTPYVYIRVTDMKDQTVSMHDLQYLDDATHRLLHRYTIDSTDLYVVIVGATIGKVGRVPEPLSGMHLTENAARLVFREFDQEFLLLTLRSQSVQSQFVAKTFQQAQPKLALNRIESTLIPVPPIAEQKRIVTKVTELLSLCDALEAKLTQAESASTQLLSAAVHHLLHNSPS